MYFFIISDIHRIYKQLNERKFSKDKFECFHRHKSHTAHFIYLNVY